MILYCHLIQNLYVTSLNYSASPYQSSPPTLRTTPQVNLSQKNHPQKKAKNLYPKAYPSQDHNLFSTSPISISTDPSQTPPPLPPPHTPPQSTQLSPPSSSPDLSLPELLTDPNWPKSARIWLAVWLFLVFSAPCLTLGVQPLRENLSWILAFYWSGEVAPFPLEVPFGV